ELEGRRERAKRRRIRHQIVESVADDRVPLENLDRVARKQAPYRCDPAEGRYDPGTADPGAVRPPGVLAIVEERQGGVPTGRRETRGRAGLPRAGPAPAAIARRDRCSLLPATPPGSATPEPTGADERDRGKHQPGGLHRPARRSRGAAAPWVLVAAARSGVVI